MKHSGSPTRVLAVHRYFWPDTPPYAALLRRIASHWVEGGARVDVLTSQPSYKPELGLTRRPRVERVDGLTIRRLSMKPDRTSRHQRVHNVVRFPALVFWRVLLGPRYDVVMCSTAPPVLLGVATCAAARLRGSAFVYHCMDIHPEIGALSGEFRNRWVFAVLRALDTWTCRRATTVVVLSQDMSDALAERAPDLASRITILNNFDLPSFEEEEQTETALVGPRDDRLRIAFAGNVGRFQGLEQVVEAVLSHDEAMAGVQLTVMGEGAVKAALEAIAAAAPAERRDRVRFLPHGPVSQARALMGEADLGLVCLVPGVISYAYPSKTASYLSEGLPVLVGVEPDSALAREVTGWGVGFVLPTGSVVAISAALAALVPRTEEIRGLRARALATWDTHFSAPRVLGEWDRLLRSTLERSA